MEVDVLVDQRARFRSALRTARVPITTLSFSAGHAVCRAHLRVKMQGPLSKNWGNCVTKDAKSQLFFFYCLSLSHIVLFYLLFNVSINKQNWHFKLLAPFLLFIFLLCNTNLNANIRTVLHCLWNYGNYPIYIHSSCMHIILFLPKQ